MGNKWVRRWATGAVLRRRAAHVAPRLGVVVALVLFVVSCGDDLPTGAGSDQRTEPDSLRIVEITTVVFDSVFHDSLEISLGASPTGQLGSQKLYTTHLLFDFGVPTFVVQDADTFELDGARLEIGILGADPQPFEGTMRLLLREVDEPWKQDSVFALPSLRPGSLADTAVARASFDDADFEIRMQFNPRDLSGFVEAVALRELLDVNVACMFDSFTVDGQGFIEFPYRPSSTGSNVRFVGDYRSAQDRRIERTSNPRQRVTVVEFDSLYTPGGNLVASDGHRWHTYLRFGDMSSVLPESAFVHAAELVLVQADRGDTLFGTGPDVGVMVPPDTTSIYTRETNERPLPFRTPIVAVPELRTTIIVTTYLFDQQEGNVDNNGMILRLSNEGTKARHFEFFGPSAADSLRPRLRIVYGMPSDFGRGGAP